eukprot:PRCOL_00006532-RA
MGKDGDGVLGCYAYGNGDDIGLRAAIVDPATGEFLRAGASSPLESTEPEDIARAVKKIADTFEWNGLIGLGLPGVVTREDVKADDSSPRLGRLALEEQLHALTGRDIMVMTGAEANGYADVAFGAVSNDTPELVLVVTLGRGIGAALFEHGMLVRNLYKHHITREWQDERWSSAALPDADTPEGDAAWGAYGERVDAFVAELAAFMKPDAIVISGSAAASFDKWKSGLTTSVPVAASEMGIVAGVKGSAYGANMQRTTLQELVELRAALGRRVTEETSGGRDFDEVLHEMFDEIDADGNGYLDVAEIQAAASRVGIKLTETEAEALVLELDTDTLHRVGISYEEFVEWYRTTKLYEAGEVQQLMSADDFESALAQEMQSGRLVCLEVGFTFCRPCKAFKPKYERIAKTMANTRMLFVNGNENSSTVELCRDTLKVRSSPSFFFFRDGKEVHRHTGANEERLKDFLDAFEADPTLVDPPPEEEGEEAERTAEAGAERAAEAKS